MNRRRTGNGNDDGLAPHAVTAAPWTPKPAGVVIECRLTPKAARDAIEGVAALADGSRVLMARVRATPEDGRANRALCAALASALGVPVSRVTILAGAKARFKRVAVAGDPETLIERLRTL